MDKVAEQAVQEAIRSLLAAGKRPCSKNVPAEARKLLVKRMRGRASRVEADKCVLDACWRLKERKEIVAPTSPHVDWEIVDRRPPGETQSERA